MGQEMNASLCLWCNDPVTVPGAAYCCEDCGEQHYIDSLRFEAGLPPLKEMDSNYDSVRTAVSAALVRN